jgi:hypothetical protein
VHTPEVAKKMRFAKCLSGMTTGKPGEFQLFLGCRMFVNDTNYWCFCSYIRTTAARLENGATLIDCPPLNRPSGSGID